MPEKANLKAWALISMVLVVVLSRGLRAAGTYSGGDGSEENPYKIADANDMNDIGAKTDDWDKYFKLTTDINLAQFTGTQFNIIGTSIKLFTGVFDGNGHTVSNFTYDSTGTNDIGLFGRLGSGGVIKNLGLINIDINVAGTVYKVGGLVGNSNKGEISNCYVTGTVTAMGSYTGGLAGHNNDAFISNCYANVIVTGNDYCGGLVGSNSGGFILNCYAYGAVSGNTNVGGFSGYNSGCISVSFWDTVTSGQANGLGIGSDLGLSGKTTAGMKSMSTYFGWGAVPTVWTIDDTNDYPHLAWENETGQTITPILSDLIDGTGTQGAPFLIDTHNELDAVGQFACEWDKHFKLVADINLSAYSASDFNMIGVFTGVFDGNNHTVSNFSFSDSSYGVRYIGLFRYVGDSGDIKDLGVIDANIDGSGQYVGCLAGQNNGSVSNCYATGDISVGSRVGGLVGSNCSEISNCYATADISGTGDHVGGLVGANYDNGNVSDCYARSTVSGRHYIGGLVGNALGFSEISNCYSSGAVSGTGNGIGGLVGQGDSRRVFNSYWDTQTSGQASSDGGEGKTTAQMQTKSTYLGWGACGSIWTIDDGNDYPHLAWENEPGEAIDEGLSDFLTGTGQPGDPYMVSTAEQLNIIRLFECGLNNSFELTTDIDLSDYNQTQFNIIGTSIKPFTGVFDGNGHTISNFTYTTTANYEYIGLFGYVSDPNAEIKNLGLIDVEIDANNSDQVGALVGYINDGTVSDCFSTGTVLGWSDVGGLVGYNYDEGAVTNSCSRCSVSGRGNLGGLVGNNYGGSISDSYALGPVYGTEDSVDPRTGGLLGYNLGNVSNCYAAGSVRGPGSYLAGFISTNSGSVSDSFWDIEASGQASGVSGGSSSGITGKTTAEMQTQTTFTDAGWDFVDIWALPYEDISYPHFTWQDPNLSGTGTQNDPHYITTPAQLNSLRSWPFYWHKYLTLGADIDMTAYGYRKAIIAPDMDTLTGFQGTEFTGVFDGAGHVINNLTINEIGLGNDYLGLFGRIGSAGQVKRLGLTNANISGRDCVGAMAGHNKGTILESYATGDVTGIGYETGGLVGRASYLISNCYAMCNVTGFDEVGGLVGMHLPDSGSYYRSDPLKARHF